MEKRRHFDTLPAHAVLLLRGGGRYRDAAGYRCEVEAGDVILVFPDRAHQYGPEPGRSWDELYLVFDGPAFDLLRTTGVLDGGRPVASGRPQRWCAQLVEFAGRPRALDPAGRCAEIAEFAALVAGTYQGGDGPPMPGFIGRSRPSAATWRCP